MPPAIEAKDLGKRYGETFVGLADASFAIQKGEFVAIVGRSGSGKTTLLNLLAGIDRPTSGTIRVLGRDIGSLDEDELAEWRGSDVGLVFQFFQLLPTLTVAENVMLPMDFAQKVPAAKRRERALALLDSVGVRDQADKMPSELSGGQQQRAAIARALANDPPILMADEPTGNLDSATARAVLDLLARLHREGRTVIVVSHERDIRDVATRVLALADGRVLETAAGAAR